MTEIIKYVVIAVVGATLVLSISSAQLFKSRYQGISASTANAPAAYVLDTYTGEVAFYILDKRQ